MVLGGARTDCRTFCMFTTACQLSQSATAQRVSVPRQAAWIESAVLSQKSIASRWSKPLHAAWMSTAALASAGVDAKPWPPAPFAGRRISNAMEPSRPRSILAAASADVTGWPSISRMTSPGSSPEPAAAPSESTRDRVGRCAAAWKERPRRMAGSALNTHSDHAVAITTLLVLGMDDDDALEFWP